MLQIARRSLPIFPRKQCGIGFSFARFASNAATGVNSSQPISGDVNIKSEANRLEKTLTKFWDKVETSFNKKTQSFETHLDGKALKTPLGNILSVPANKKQLAYLVSHEWENLIDLKIKPNSLPLTSMVARATDLGIVFGSEEVDKDLVTKVGDLQDIKYNILRYLNTDTCLIFTTLDEYEGRLRNKQEELYRPLIEEFESYFTEFGRKKDLLPSPDHKVELTYLDCETDGIRGNSQTITTQNIVLLWLDSLPIYDLVALEKAVLSSKSFLCGAAIVRSNASDSQIQSELYQVNKANEAEYFKKSVEEIVEMGNLETIFQTQEWGEVEDTHDVDNADWLRSLSSAALVCR